ncbi:hypothetical protein CCUG60885_04528 [Mycobacteroides salmoniphilum]|uniref:Uncharacterized protein n=1 Tax=Mycobacteroides salmoniphilum TaxID=404941 RepID=A0A4R8SAJ7_9MYCO|nr:hypothetical protein CCUG60885_04528 [Mycobacteroides salmoniphilum]TEA00901.1 hypothetical protein CCUG60883_04522 [Mycobacteroides salmoniphilum]
MYQLGTPALGEFGINRSATAVPGGNRLGGHSYRLTVVWPLRDTRAAGAVQVSTVGGLTFVD